MKKVILIILGVIILFVAFILFNTFTFQSKQIEVKSIDQFEVPATVKTHLSQAIQIRTISPEHPEDFDSTAFYEFRDFLENAYVLVDSMLEQTVINEFSLIYKWSGKNESLKPIILMGHIDVVPVDVENLDRWTQEPFSGLIKDGIIWGRGAIDDKISVIGNLEAIEYLLSQGFQPERTIYLCFGHDEELGGLNGAVPIVEHLKNQGVEAEYVVDEGFAVTQGLIPGIEKDVALIGTAEKGFVTLELSVAVEGGHSSMPKKETAIDIVSNAVVKLKKNPFDPELSQPVKDFMAHAGPEMTFAQKMAFANPGIFQSMIFSIYEAQPSGNALIRTTTSPTIIKGGIKENVIPYEARATVNFRILPGTSIQEVIDRVKTVIDDERIVITEGKFSSEAPQSSSVDSFGYEALNKTILEIFPDVVVSPNLVIGATDSRYYYPLSKDVYRFTPFHLNNDNISTFHGVDERIAVEEFENAVRFYIQLIRNSTSK